MSEDEKQHSVTVNDSYIGKYIVFFHVYKEISREQGNRLFLEMYKSIKKEI